MRGCLSDIIHFNRTAIRIYDYSAKSSTSMMNFERTNNNNPQRNFYGSYTFCTFIRLRDLFVGLERYAFEKGDQIELCTCIKSLCNHSTRSTTNLNYLKLLLFSITIIWWTITRNFIVLKNLI